MEGRRSRWNQAGASAWGANILKKNSLFGVGDCEVSHLASKTQAHGDEESDEAHCDSFWCFSLVR